ncbi:MAG TPA: LamG domain-containing protein [Pyrinomonadaceae bacterium]|nr:LamG domain-containing protein [Pyrinomonadaceae bacterium]
MKIFAVLILLFFAFTSFAQTPKTPKKSVTWKINNLKKIGGNSVEVLGNPQIIKTERGKAVLFDGVDDALFINKNPLAGFPEFTVEAVFRPLAGGAKEQRWLHIEDTENTESRALLETRLTGDEWFLDTFLKSGDNRSALFAENFKHPLGQWYAVALVFDGKEMRHYINGKLELSGKISIKPFGKGITSIGVRQNKIYWFKGAVRKLRFTNRALSTNEFMK